MQSSSTPMSIHESAFDTPMRSAKRRKPSGVKPRRRAPTSVGILGSSQPSTWPFGDELDQPALRQHDVGEVEPRELVLLRQRARELAAVGELLDHPVVQRPVVLELERADRMRDALERVRDAVRVVVERIDAPLVAGPVVRGVPDPVDRRVAHVDVRARHVDLEPQHVRAVGELAGAHPAEEIEVLGNGRSRYGLALPGLGQRAAQRAHLVGRLAVDVREALFNEPLGETSRGRRSSRTRDRGARPSRSRASAPSPRSTPRTRRLP